MREYLGKFIIYYLDNILIYSENNEKYKIYIKLVLYTLLKVNSRLKFSKYKFGITKILFLGYIIRLRQISINPEKIQKIKDWPKL